MTKITPEQLTQQGWAKFEASDFGDACGDFGAAIDLDPDYEPAYLGLGWAELRLSNAGMAENAFITYLSKISGSDDDATAGLAFAYDAQEKYGDAIEKAEQLLSANPSWSFTHDPGVNHLDVALVLAEAYYQTAEYSQSLSIVQEYFDASFSPDLGTDEGRAQLADKLQELYTG
ncbi:MAG: tetratricopeptide repeat protein [candidate division Zixibacteria bacterium]|nr:tetratricopeptide repeat protein [candidate division Zixibacteria bacterium]